MLKVRSEVIEVSVKSIFSNHDLQMFSFNAIAEQRRLTIKCEQLEKYLTKSDQKSRAFQAHAKDYVRKMEMTYVSTVLDMIGGMKCDEKKCHPILRSIVSRLDPLYAKHILAMHILKHSGETTYPLPPVIVDKSARDILSARPKDEMSPCWDYICFGKLQTCSRRER